jgi:hypothetical protein
MSTGWSDDEDDEVRRKTSLTSYFHFLYFRRSHATRSSDNLNLQNTFTNTRRWHLPNPFIFEVPMDLSLKADTAAGPYRLLE